MGKLLPVRESATPYRYVTDNLKAVWGELQRELTHHTSNGYLERQRLLATIEALQLIRDDFRSNGWSE